MMGNAVIALVWIPQWPTCSLAIDVPAGSAAVISRGGKVLHATIAAKREGVREGMKITLARHLSSKLIELDYDPARDARTFDVILDALNAVTPMPVAIRPGIAFFNAKAALKYGTTAEQLQIQTINAVADAGAEAYIGLGTDLLHAWVAATTGKEPTEQTIANLPLRYLQGLAPIQNLVNNLHPLGIHTVGQAKTVGLSDIATRFGLEGVTLQQLLETTGAKQAWNYPAKNIKTANNIEEQIIFESPVTDVALAVGRIQRLSINLIRKLVEQQAAPRIITATVTVTAEGQTQECERHWALPDFPTPREITDRVRWQIQGWLDALSRKNAAHQAESQEPWGFTNIHLTASELTPIGEQTRSLWGQRCASDQRASRTALKLQAQNGVETVQRVHVTQGYNPAERMRYYNWGEQTPQEPWETWRLPDQYAYHGNYQPTDRWEGQINGAAPATVLDTPTPVQVYDETEQPVSVRDGGNITATPRTITLEKPSFQNPPGTLAQSSLETPSQPSLDTPSQNLIGPPFQAPFPSPNRHTIKRVRGPWPILGQWWSGEEPQVLLALECENIPALLVGWRAGAWTLRAVWF
ncbi:hypothetical protein [Gleimia hominis]|uniref:hypothetical protein n=1 Tax=Gleimia hominis TaxID=595468 RepID=UPI0011AF2004|nr:hypothetical protein [Gleimia hominis]WIK64984.1 hypothetical protein CJ187_002720 [Gleimia hominis]